jgi:catechol-2,3-dioxygenase
MEQRLGMVTLGVADLERAKAFYEDVVGWTALARLKPLFSISVELCSPYIHIKTWRRIGTSRPIPMITAPPKDSLSPTTPAARTMSI